MGLSSTVAWDGHTKLLLDLKNAAANSGRLMYEATLELGQEHLILYKENLNGTAPSSASDPIPVGVRTGELLAGARLDDGGTGGGTVNQYVYSIKNDVPYAGWIEDGTAHMAPRHPLQNSVDIMAGRYSAKLDETMTTITESS